MFHAPPMRRVTRTSFILLGILSVASRSALLRGLDWRAVRQVSDTRDRFRQTQDDRAPASRRAR
jgi:hypothetical protein